MGFGQGKGFTAKEKTLMTKYTLAVGGVTVSKSMTGKLTTSVSTSVS